MIETGAILNNIIAVGASAGGVEALRAIVRELPGDLPAPIVPERIYTAPADFQLAVERGRMRVYRGPRENRYRPAIDPLFRSVAKVYGERAAAKRFRQTGSRSLAERYDKAARSPRQHADVIRSMIGQRNN